MRRKRTLWLEAPEVTPLVPSHRGLPYAERSTQREDEYQVVFAKPHSRSRICFCFLLLSSSETFMTTGFIYPALCSQYESVIEFILFMQPFSCN